VRVPFLDAEDEAFPLSRPAVDGFGDISAGLKAALLFDCETGSALSVGMTVSAPTARKQVVLTNGVTNSPSFSTFETINPTFLQPWIGGVVVLDRLSIQEYLGVIVPTDERVATFINNDIGMGYQIYRCQNRFLSSIAPTIDVQALIPVNNTGVTPRLPLNQPVTLPSPVTPGNEVVPFNPRFPDQVFVSPGVQLGLGDRALLSAGVPIPVVGPKAFSVGVNVGFNLFF
jgi:hypothetical protein